MKYKTINVPPSNLVVEGDSEGSHPEPHTVDKRLSVVALPISLVHQVVRQLAYKQEKVEKNKNKYVNNNKTIVDSQRYLRDKESSHGSICTDTYMDADVKYEYK